jgi:hypothetical protein
MNNQIESSPVGWRVAEFARAIRISRAGFYLLPPEHRPRAVKIGKRHIIIESPADWLRRMADRGGIPIPRKAAGKA